MVTSIPADETVANVPDWQEDTNGAIGSGGATATFSYSLSTAADAMAARLRVDNAAGSGQDVQLSLDGASNYSFKMTAGGTSADGASSFTACEWQGSGDGLAGWLVADVLPSGEVSVAAQLGAGRQFSASPVLTGGACDATTPIQGITIEGATGDVTVSEFQVFRL